MIKNPECNICLNESISKYVNKREHIECRGCNLGIFGNCDCYYYDIQIIIYWCQRCNHEIFKCQNCNNYYNNLLNNICSRCIEIIKNNDPSDENSMYFFDENSSIKWVLYKKKYTCISCNNSEYYYDDHENFKLDINNYICINCNLEKLKQSFDNCKFKIKKLKTCEKIYFKKLCNCKKYTDWIEICYINENNIIIQCKMCNPSTLLKLYNYNDTTHIWYLYKIGDKCNLCDNILLRGIYERNYKADILQCKNCKPNHKYIQFKFINTGWKKNKIKVFDGFKHKWIKTLAPLDINYMCDCNKCTLNKNRK